jgi:hypothetical protein
MAGGFTVRASELAAGSGQVTAQQNRWDQVASAVVEAIAQMAGAAGHPGLTSALVGASETGTETFLVAQGLYAHVSQGLEQSAANYNQTEQGIISRLGGPR